MQGVASHMATLAGVFFLGWRTKAVWCPNGRKMEVNGRVWGSVIGISEARRERGDWRPWPGGQMSVWYVEGV